MEEEGSSLNHSALRVLWEHHWWSFEKLLDAVKSLDEEEFKRDVGLSYGSVHGQLAHIVGSEVVWLRRVLRGESVSSVPGAEELPDLSAIETAWREMRAGWRRVLETEDLERTVLYRNTRGEEFSDPLWRVMAHLVDHGAAYRGILISALRLLQRTPPATGVITYTRSTSDKR
jgi:uncharacterized damage-inducible protein DinB